jgi:hypothetical protein
VKIDADKGILTFKAKKGMSLDPDELFDAIKKTSFHSTLSYLEIKVMGVIAVGEKETLLKVSSTAQKFVLGPDPTAKPKEGEATPFQRLQKALGSGAKVVSVTGRVDAWGGDFRRGKKEKDAKEPEAPAKKGPPLLIVKDFEMAVLPK